jgi:hypothetical protein
MIEKIQVCVMELKDVVVCMTWTWCTSPVAAMGCSNPLSCLKLSMRPAARADRPHAPGAYEQRGNLTVPSNLLVDYMNTT